MGRLKTKKSVAAKDLRKAHRMAEAFAIHKTNTYLRNFLGNSGLVAAMYSYYENMQNLWKKDLDKLKAALATELGKTEISDIEVKRLENEISDIEPHLDETMMTAVEYMQKMCADLDLSFGGALAIAYATGYADACNGATLKEIYHDGKQGPKIAMPGEQPSIDLSEGPPVLTEEQIAALPPEIDRPGKIIMPEAFKAQSKPLILPGQE